MCVCVCVCVCVSYNVWLCLVSVPLWVLILIGGIVGIILLAGAIIVCKKWCEATKCAHTGYNEVSESPSGADIDRDVPLPGSVSPAEKVQTLPSIIMLGNGVAKGYPL